MPIQNNRRSIQKLGTAAAAAAVLSFMFATAPAMGAQNQQAPQAAQPGHQNFSDKDLDSFADAYLGVMKVRQSYGPKINAANSAKEKQQMQQEAVKNMAGAVRQSGITVAEYNQITNASKTDTDLQKRIITKIKSHAKSQSK